MNDKDLLKDATDLYKEVCKIYNKTENEVNEDIETIKKWLQMQHHFPEIMRESHIRNFLIVNKFSIEKTKQKIDAYYTIRSLIPDFFGDCNPKSPSMQNFYKQGVAGIHPTLIQGLYRVYIAKLDAPESGLSPREAVLAVCNCKEIRLHEDCLFYDIYVLDLTNITLRDVTRITPAIIMKAATIYEKVYSFCFKSAYVVNAPIHTGKAMALLKMFLKPKIFERIHVYENDDILKEIFTIDALPKDYGGNGPSLQEINDNTLKKFEQYQDRFDELDRMRVDESLRPEKLVNDEILGYYGNFRQLSID